MIFSLEIETLARLIIDDARGRSLRIVTAESCTGGGIAARLCAVPGASDVFWGGVVAYANEIKELAQQTARATEDIKGRIAGVQSSTAGGIAEIDKVSAIIHEVSDIVASIAAAIEEQSTVTKDIARNIAEASTGVRDANKRVSEASQATAEIAREIVVVDQAAGQMAEGSQQVQSSATELSRVAEQLQVTVQRFKV